MFLFNLYDKDVLSSKLNKLFIFFENYILFYYLIDVN